MKVHLWEANHPYYCNQGNYFSNDCGSHHKSFAQFIELEGDGDMDLNLIFRWDWCEDPDEGHAFTGDVNYRNGELRIFWMGQRKGLYRYTTIEVCRSDEDAVRAFLMPRWKNMVAMWQPLSGAFFIDQSLGAP